jgi:SHS2 domain-containing protein
MFDGFVRFAPTPPDTTWSFSCSGADYEELLVRFLGTLLRRHDTDHSLFLDFRIKELTPTHLEAEVDVAPHGHPAEYFGAPVKAVTFHGLEVKKTPKGAMVRVIFDV